MRDTRAHKRHPDKYSYSRARTVQQQQPERTPDPFFSATPAHARNGFLPQVPLADLIVVGEWGVCRPTERSGLGMQPVDSMMCGRQWGRNRPRTSYSSHSFPHTQFKQSPPCPFSLALYILTYVSVYYSSMMMQSPSVPLPPRWAKKHKRTTNYHAHTSSALPPRTHLTSPHRVIRRHMGSGGYSTVGLPPPR